MTIQFRVEYFIRNVDSLRTLYGECFKWSELEERLRKAIDLAGQFKIERIERLPDNESWIPKYTTVFIQTDKDSKRYVLACSIYVHDDIEGEPKKYIRNWTLKGVSSKEKVYFAYDEDEWPLCHALENPEIAVSVFKEFFLNGELSQQTLANFT